MSHGPRSAASPARRRLLVPSFVAMTALLGSLFSAGPASAITLAEVDPDVTKWAATPYSPLPWEEVAAPGNTASLTFDGGTSGLPDAAGVGTGFTAVQPSSAALSSPYYVPQNLSVAGGKLTVTASNGIQNAAVNTQDNALGLGVAAKDRQFVLTTTLDSPAAANSFAQAGLWFGADDKNYAKLVIIGNGAAGSTTRQIQLAKEVNDVSISPAGTSSTSADQVILATTQPTLAAGPITLNMAVDGVNRKIFASYRIGTGNVTPLGALENVPASFFDGSLLSATKPADSPVTAFGGIFATKRNMPVGTPLAYSFENFGFGEADLAAPAAPANLAATAVPSGVTLAWAPSEETDLTGYRVYRSTTSPVSTTGTPISGPTPVTATTFSDTATFSGVNYHYAVVAGDTLGNTSPTSSTGPVASATPAGEPVAKIDFTTPLGSAAAGYTKDGGSAYSAAAGSGWLDLAGAPFDNTAATRVRGIAGSDPRLDSIVHLQYKATSTSTPVESTWRYDVPNGRYTVVAAVGDSGTGVSNGYDSQHTISVEGQKIFDRFQASAARPFDEAVVADVTVTDGTISIDPLGGANSKLAYVEIYRTALTLVTPAVPSGLTAAIDGEDVTVSWAPAADAVSYRVYRDTDADVDTTGEPLATVESPSYTDLTTAEATSYYYAVIATSKDKLDSAASAALKVDVPEIEDPTPPQLCQPDEWKAELFSGTALAGTPKNIVCVSAIDQSYTGGAIPAGLDSPNQYSVRWTRTINQGAGSYELTTRTDDGVRVSIDGTSVLNEWYAQSADRTRTVQVPLADGPHQVVVEYYQGFGDGSAKVTFKKTITSCATGEWLAEYFENTSLTGTVAHRECVADIDQSFASGEAPEGISSSNLYSVRWTRTINEGKGTYRFSAATDDGVRVKVDGALVIDEWRDQSADETHTAERTLAAGSHQIVVEYYQGYNEASATVGYEKTSSDTEAPDAPTNVVTTAGTDAITVRWAASTATDTVGYRVYRGTTPTVATTGDGIAGATPVSALTFVDTTAEKEVPYYYVVVAVDDSDNASAASASAPGVITVVPDTEAPTGPTALAAAPKDSAVTLTWTASASTDVAGYRIYRGTEPAVSTSGTPVSGTTPVTATTFTDSTVTNGTTYFYVAVAVDLAGNRSAASNEVVAVPLVPNTTNVKVDFTATDAAPVAGYLADWGQAYGLRTGATQGAGTVSYGWLSEDGNATSLVTNGRDRNRAGVPALLDSILHMQYGDANGGTGTNGVKTEGVWELAVPDGLYSVKVAVGDEADAGGGYEANHVINVEGSVGIEKFVGSAAAEYSTVTSTVGVWDGKLTIDAQGGVNTKIAYIEVLGLTRAPHVDTVLPENRVVGHDVNAGVSASIKIPYAGVGVRPSSMPGNVHLYNVATGALVPTTVGTSGGNDVISLAPNDPLAPNTAYRFVVTSGVTDNFGVPFVPFTSVFTTGSGEVTSSDEFTPAKGISFQKIELPTGRGKYWSSYAFGPDGKLYGTTIGEGIFRFTVNADGTLGEPESLGYEGFAHIGLLFDKSSTANDLRLWVTRTSANFSEQGQWVSSIHQLSGPNLATDRSIFTSLPRSLSDHLTNSMAYGPDGRIYFQQGSNQASGDLDNAWGQRGEQLLTGATLVFDPANGQIQTAANGGGAIDVKTAQGGTYNPYTPTAPLKIYATGIRNAYDLVWHSNNHLYVATNGTAGGANTPGVTANANGTFTRTAAAGIPGFSTVNGTDVTPQCVRRGYTGGTVPPTGNIPTQKDLLFDVVEGGYYGHPNPERCEFVLNAGNDAATPTAPGTKESKYPLGTKADPNYRGVAYDFEFNKSPNGALEYKSSTFGGQLKGRLVVTRFSNNNDLIFLQPDKATGKVLGAQTSVGITGVANTTMSGVDGFNDPLEVVEDPKTGNLYVNQYDRSGSDQRMYLLRVPASQQASTVSASVNELVFSAVKSTQSAAKTVTVTNNSAQAVTVNTALTGGQAGEFTVTGGNVSVPAQGSITLSVRFTPGTTVGQRASTLRLTAGTSTTDIGVYGLTMNGIEGSNEPTLANVLGTLGYGVNVGWTNLEGGTQPVAKGDEVLEPLFVKSGTAAPTMTPLAQYAPREDLPFGWYTGDGVGADLHKLGSIDISGYQSLLPPSSPGTVASFDPAAQKFGFFYVSNVFKRTGFTEDRLNTGIAHRARVYPAKNRTGTTIPNTYIVGFEDAANGDYQDYLFLVTGVKPATDTGSVDGGIRVDFTTKAAQLPVGYLRDYGQAFSLRTEADQGTSLSYGWKNDTTENDVDLSTGGTAGNGRDRASAQTDQRLDTFMHMQGAMVPNFNGNPTNAYWEVALPNGQYDVTVAVGDPAPQSDVEIHQINLEHDPAIALFRPTGVAGANSRHTTVTRTVTIEDGFLTVDARGGTNTKISYIDILPVTAPGGGDGDDPTDGAQVKVSFGTPDAPAVTGWSRDSGAPFSTTTGSGWVTTGGTPVDRATFMRHRAAATAGISFPTDPLLRTGAHLQEPTEARWEYVVPNGTYEVAASVGDSAFLDSVHTVTAEGQPVVATFTPTGTTPFQTGKRTVTVTDGRLTIAGTGDNTKVNWVSIKGEGLDGPAVPATPTTKINFQPDSVPAPSGWTADTGAGYTAARGYGWLVNGQPADRSASTRYRAAPTAGISYPAGDVTRQTFIITQSGTVDVSDGVWQYALANGTYDVSVSVGDSGFLDSVHGVNVEGTSVVSGYVPTGGAPFSTGTAKVTVTDGMLTLTPTGTNTKVNWITIAGQTLSAPSLTVTANGQSVGTSYTGAPATIAVAAQAAGGATIASVTYALNGAAATAYTGPITVNQIGAQQLVVTATDSEGRATTRTIALTIEDIGGTVTLRNEQVTRVNGAPAPGFSEDWVALQRINSGVTTHQVMDQATVTVTNTGAKNLRISGMTLGGANAGQFEIVNPPTTPLTVAPGASTPVTVKFIANSGSRGVRSAQLTIASSDPAKPATVVQLRGGYMGAPEGGSELTLPEITALFGWTTSIGTLVNGDEMRTSPLKGEEVRTLQWKRADTTLPVTARQLAAFHGCCEQTERITINGVGSTHIAPYSQSILPPSSTAGAPTQVSTSPAGNFTFSVSGQTTNNVNYMALKTWPVRDRSGVIVPGAWIVGHDYISSPNQCGIAPTNCDFQDNVYLITNMLPVASSDTTAPVAPAASAAVTGTSATISWTPSTSTDVGGYAVERATAAEGPWTRISGQTPVSGTSFVDATAPAFVNTVYYRVLAVDASGNTAASAAAALDISSMPGRSLLLAANATAVTTGGRTWLPDAPYAAGGRLYRNPAVTQIAGTTDDALYLSERSETTTFGYNVPVPSGTYLVRLHYAEIYHGATGGGTGGTGKRIFSVNFEGGTTPEIPRLDLNAQVAPMTAYVTTNSVVVTDGNMDIDFAATVDFPSVSAVEIVRTGDAPAPPAAPTAVTATASATGATVSWTAAERAVGYYVEKSATPTGTFTRVSGTADLTGTSYTDTALAEGATASYRVVAVGVTGLTSAPSGTATVTRPLTAPTAPSALTATGTTAAVNLAWTASSARAVGYYVERATAATGPWTRISGEANLTATTFADTTAVAGTAYFYRAVAVGATGLTSAASNTATGTRTVAPVAPAAPAGVTATGSATGVALAWTASPSATGYVVERAASATGTFARISAATPLTATTFTDTTGTAGTTYAYRVIAVGSTGLTSAPSAVVTGSKTAPAAGSTIRINAGGPAVTTGGVTWAADSGFVGGKTYTNGSVSAIAGTTDDVLYRTERSDPSFAYDIPVANGTYTVRLHFAEIFHGATGGGAGGTGKRVFDVNLEGGALELDNLDINARVAPMTAFVSSHTVTVTGGVLDIDFLASVDQAKISAIEVIPVAAPVAPAAPAGVTATGSATGV
ncbi:malectin domain-containing carbohydrate-binding protein, partial [Microbacteriaceae bacterium 4G12]